MKSRMWTWTCFLAEGVTEVTSEMKETLRALVCSWMMCQLERTTTGRLHLQGVVLFKTPRTIGGTKNRMPPGTHLEVSKGTAAHNAEYCSKQESRVGAPNGWSLETGTQPLGQGKRTDALEVMSYARDHTISEAWTEYPRFMLRYGKSIERFKDQTARKQKTQPRVVIYWGPTGTGKSHKCREVALEHVENYYSMVTPASAKVVPWVDGYQSHEVVVIEDFSGEINYRILLRMLDKYPNMMQVKGGMTEWAPTLILISSNKHPRDWYPTERYEDGPLQRRLETDSTGSIINLKEKYVAPIDLNGLMEIE